MEKNYSKTLLLPSTSFNLRGQLSKKEPLILKWWQDNAIETVQASLRNGHKPFILHDGPPYANGPIHMGHALNKILKDFINRSAFMLGYRTAFVPGWDCHGLPIEAKIEEEFRGQKIDKKSVDTVAFRKKCRDFASFWVSHQKAELKRLGVGGFWDQAYETMDLTFEVGIVKQVLSLLQGGYIYRGTKPVLWSPVEETALAEAEVEYKTIVSRALYVAFPIVNKKTLPDFNSSSEHTLSPLLKQGQQPQKLKALEEEGDLLDALKGASVAIWTTTPWTLPANRAICYGEDFEYILIQVNTTKKDGTTLSESLSSKEKAQFDPSVESSKLGLLVGRKILLAQECLEHFLKEVGIDEYTVEKHFTGKELEGFFCAHPFQSKGYDYEVPLLPAPHVTVDAGTGFVHTAPNHGLEDFHIAKKLPPERALDLKDTIDGKGFYLDHVPLFKGQHIWKVYPGVRQELLQSGHLLQDLPYSHSYPHSWRSKTPLIYRTTPQWFVAMDGEVNGEENDANNKRIKSLRQGALEAIKSVEWFPSSAQNRITSMVQQRPDWCISRQRLWGVPMPFFVHKSTGEPLKDEKVIERTIELFSLEGIDVWFSEKAFEVLVPDYNPEDFEKIHDIVDVWFESGVTQQIVLKGAYGSDPKQNAQYFGLTWPAAMYLEGSDQHRGWFQSSLLTACALEGVRGRKPQAPFERVLTHGFLLNESSEKMSKSSGNALSPKDIIESDGADILRLWVANSYYPDDVVIGKGILDQSKEIYGRFRNTLRYLLGNLKGFSVEEWVECKDLPKLEQWVLGRLFELTGSLHKKMDAFSYQDAVQLLHNFCTGELSSFYFDIRKDVLYCDSVHSLERRSCRTVLALLFSFLCRWLAPFLSFTMEEAWSVFGRDILKILKASEKNGDTNLRNPDPNNTQHTQDSPTSLWEEPLLKNFPETFKESTPSKEPQNSDLCISSQEYELMEKLGVSQVYKDLPSATQSPLPVMGDPLSRGGRNHLWSVHLQAFPQLITAWENPTLLKHIEQLRKIRLVITGAIEKARQKKLLGASLQAKIILYLGPTHMDLLETFQGKAQGRDLKEKKILLGDFLRDLSIVSALEIQNLFPAETEGSLDNTFTLEHAPDVAVNLLIAPGEKCERCWKVLPEVELSSISLCHRCTSVIQ
jgi:isoleucyl-tRNA synthetase